MGLQLFLRGVQFVKGGQIYIHVQVPGEAAASGDHARGPGAERGPARPGSIPHFISYISQKKDSMLWGLNFYEG